MYFLAIILICSFAIYLPHAIINPWNVPNPWVYYLLAVAIYVIGEVILDGIIAFIIRRLPEKWMNPRKGIIHASEKELAFLKAIKVESWKRFMPDLGMFTKFQKGKLSDPYNNEYIHKYIVEASYGVVIHYFSVPFGFLIFLLGLIQPDNMTTWSVGIPVVFVNSVLILLPALTLKYNIPRLLRIYDLNERLKAKKVAKEAEENK